MSTKVFIVFGFLLVLSCKAGEMSHHVADLPDEDLSKYTYKPKKKTVQENSLVQDKTMPQLVFEKQVNTTVNLILDSMAVSNKRYQSASGYRIMVYSGGSSEESSKAKATVYDWSTEHDVYTQYKQPAFRVKVGNFPDRVNAYHVLSDIIKIFPNAVIIPDQIEIK